MMRPIGADIIGQEDEDFASEDETVSTQHSDPQAQLDTLWNWTLKHAGHYHCVHRPIR